MQFSTADMPTTHVVSQGLAEELKEAGWPQKDSEFYWEMCDLYLENGAYVGEGNGFEDWDVVHSSGDGLTDGDEDHVAAPLASELMERMPGLIGGRFLRITKTASEDYLAFYEDNTLGAPVDDTTIEDQLDKTLPDALAKLALHLMKEGKMTS